MKDARGALVIKDFPKGGRGAGVGEKSLAMSSAEKSLGPDDETSFRDFRLLPLCPRVGY